MPDAIERIRQLLPGQVKAKFKWFNVDGTLIQQPAITLVKLYAEAQLEKAGWRVDYVLSHAAPLQYEPRHAFMLGLDQDEVDKSTEEWLDGIEKRLTYEKWFCGHYHIDDQEGPIRIVQDEFIELDEWEV